MVDRTCGTCTHSAKTDDAESADESIAKLASSDSVSDELVSAQNKRWCWCPECSPGALNVGALGVASLALLKRFECTPKWRTPRDILTRCDCGHWEPDLGELAKLTESADER